MLLFGCRGVPPTSRHVRVRAHILAINKPIRACISRFYSKSTFFGCPTLHHSMSFSPLKHVRNVWTHGLVTVRPGWGLRCTQAISPLKKGQGRHPGSQNRGARRRALRPICVSPLNKGSDAPQKHTHTRIEQVILSVKTLLK